MDDAVNNAEVFRDSGHVIAALSDAPASQIPPNDIDVTNSGQGEEFRVSTHLSIKGKSYADCLRNNDHSFPGPEAEQATAPTGVTNADSGPRSDAAGKELNNDAHDYDQCDVYAQGDGEDACESDSYDEYEYDECDFDDQGSGDADAESCDDEAEAYDVYDSDDYDDDLDPLHDSCESEIDDIEFSDAECGEESPSLNTVLQTESTRTQNYAISGPEVGERASRSGPGTDAPAADRSSSQAASDPPRRQSPKRTGLTGGFITRVCFFMMLFGGVLMETAVHLPAAPNSSLILGWDCSRPDALQSFDRSSFCDLGRPTPRPGHPTATFQLAQVVWTSEIDAWDCRAVSTTTTHICGLWGYEKAVPSMTERTLLKLSPAECYQLSSRGTYKTEQGRVLSGIAAPGYSTAQFNLRGWDGIKNGDAACLGVKMMKKTTGEELSR
ncbi:MAG: hypothetical protein VYB01_09385, partial [Pseudomonadota bacterium]|nr:hypothetical protein [Pseudomonadota bacterium]